MNISNLTDSITCGKIQDCVSCLPFDISLNIFYLIFGYYVAVYLGYFLKFSINKGYLDKGFDMDLTRYYLEFSQLVLVLLYFALRPSDYITLGFMAVLIFGSLIIRKKYLPKKKELEKDC